MLEQAEADSGTEGTAPSSDPTAGSKRPAVKTAQSEVPEDAVTVYLQDPKGYLAPMTLRIGSKEELESIHATAETALTWLTADKIRSEQLPEGFSAVLPENAKVETVKLDAETGTAAIDFAAPLPDLPAAKERKMLEAIVWSITEIPGIDKVKLTVSGKPIRSLPASGMPVDEVLTRGIGINVEPVRGVAPSRSMAVTLYFSARSASGDGYFVPVTRLIDRTNDRIRAALQELAEGPDDGQALQADLPPGITVDKLTRQADTVNVSLNNKGWTSDQEVSSDMMEAIVLTLTEAAGTPSVKVAMNGDDSFLDSEQRAYDRPVTRPVAVNMLER